jgi:hypothetical protein
MSNQSAPRRSPLPEGFDWRAITPADSPKTPPDLFGDPAFRELATAKLAPGDRAFDFERPLFDFALGARRETGHRFRLLESARARPVALVFGSYT